MVWMFWIWNLFSQEYASLNLSYLGWNSTHLWPNPQKSFKRAPNLLETNSDCLRHISTEIQTSRRQYYYRVSGQVIEKFSILSRKIHATINRCIDVYRYVKMILLSLFLCLAVIIQSASNFLCFEAYTSHWFTYILAHQMTVVQTVWRQMKQWYMSDGLLQGTNPGICLEGLREIMKSPSYDSQCPTWDLNWAPPNTNLMCYCLSHITWYILHWDMYMQFQTF